MWFMFGEIHFTRRHPAVTNMCLKQIFIYMVAISAIVYGAPPDIDKHHGSIEVISKQPEKLIELVTEPTLVIYTTPQKIAIDPPKIITINNKDDSKSNSSIKHEEVFVQKHIDQKHLNNEKKPHNNEHVYEHLLSHNRDKRNPEHLSQLHSDEKNKHISQNDGHVNEHAQLHSDTEKKHISHQEHYGHLEITKQPEKLIELVTEPTHVLVTKPPIIRTDPPKIITINQNQNDPKYIISDLMNVESESKSSSTIKHEEVFVQKHIDQQLLNNEQKSHHKEHVDEHLLRHTRDEVNKHISHHDEHELEHLSQLHGDGKNKPISQNDEYKHVVLHSDIEKKPISHHDEHVHEHTLLHSDDKKEHISHQNKHEHGNSHVDSDDKNIHNSHHDEDKHVSHHQEQEHEHLSHQHKHGHDHLSHHHEHEHDHLSHHHEHEHLAHPQEQHHLSEEKKRIPHHSCSCSSIPWHQQEYQKTNKQVVGAKKQISDTQIVENISSGSITKIDHQQQGEVKRNNVGQGTNEQEQQGSLNTNIEHIVPKQEVARPSEHVVTVHKKVEHKHEPVKKIIVEHTHTHQPAKMVQHHHEQYVPIKHEHKHHVVVNHDHDHTVSLKHEEHVPVYHHQKAYHHNEHHFDSHYHIDDDDDDDEDNFYNDHYDYHSY